MAPNMTEEELDAQIELLRQYFNINQYLYGQELVAYKYFVTGIKSSYHGLPAHKITSQLSQIYGKPTATVSSSLKYYLNKSIRTRRNKYEQLLGTPDTPKAATIIEVMANWLHEYQGHEENGFIIWERRDSTALDNKNRILLEIVNLIRQIDPKIEGIKISPYNSGFIYIYYIDKPREKIYVGNSVGYDFIIDVLMACMTTWRRANANEIG